MKSSVKGLGLDCGFVGQVELDVLRGEACEKPWLFSDLVCHKKITQETKVHPQSLLRQPLADSS